MPRLKSQRPAPTVLGEPALDEAGPSAPAREVAPQPEPNVPVPMQSGYQGPQAEQILRGLPASLTNEMKALSVRECTSAICLVCNIERTRNRILGLSRCRLRSAVAQCRCRWLSGGGPFMPDAVRHPPPPQAGAAAASAAPPSSASARCATTRSGPLTLRPCYAMPFEAARTASSSP